MSSEKDIFKNPPQEFKQETIHFSLQASETKPLDLSRIMGKPVEAEEDTAATQATSQEGEEI